MLKKCRGHFREEQSSNKNCHMHINNKYEIVKTCSFQFMNECLQVALLTQTHYFVLK